MSIEEGLGSRGYTDEGRTLTLEFDGFYLVTAYVPNSGQDLKRLGYRINEWERDMRAAFEGIGREETRRVRR